MKEVIVLNKKRGGKVIIFVLIMVFIYYIYVLLATNAVMKMAKNLLSQQKMLKQCGL